MMYHNPVLLNESISGLNINPSGIYVDVTYGGGGHSQEILKNLNSNGKLIAFDQDQDAIENKSNDSGLNLINSNFKYLLLGLPLFFVCFLLIHNLSIFEIISNA